MKYTLLVLVTMGLASCGVVSFQTMTLDSGVPQPPTEDGFKYFRSKQVFSNDITDVWGLEKDACKNFEQVKLEAPYASAIQLSWNKTSCDWVGFGIGWDAWAPKDISSITDIGAFVMDVRSIEGETTIPTLIFLLEDYAGTMSAGVFGASAISSYPINEEWQQCVLPFNKFDIESSGLDPTNIKQLVIECQGAGNIIIDNIHIAKAEKRILPGKKEFPAFNVPAKPVSIFEDEFQNVWGLGNNYGRNFEIVASPKHGNVIEAKWTPHDNPSLYREFGFNWESWKQIDARDFDGDFAFAIKNLKDDVTPNIQVILESYNGAWHPITLSEEYFDSFDFTKEWRTYRIPLKEYYNNIDESQIKQIKFRFLEDGHVLIDDLRIER